MAIPTSNPQVTVIGVPKFKPDQQKRRRNRNIKPAVVVSDESTYASSSESSNSDVKPQRRRQPKKRNKKNQTPKELGADLSLEEKAKYVAMDCEMVGVGSNGTKSSVARVTLVGWSGEVIFDELVKQEEPVTDYRTFVSGITESALESATLTLDECRGKILDLFEGKILVGHALKNDMKALNISHPWFMTRDTAKYEPFMQVRFDDGILWPRKLKELTHEKLKREIQLPGQAHSAYEDALAALDLYRLVRQKWEKAMDYKIKKTQEIQSKNVEPCSD